MTPIVEEPRSDDDFYSPDLIRFACAAFPWVSAAWAALWFVVAMGDSCVDRECDSDPFIGVILLVWASVQIASGVVSVGGLIHLLATQGLRDKATAVAATGVITMLALSAATGTGLTTRI